MPVDTSYLSMIAVFFVYTMNRSDGIASHSKSCAILPRALSFQLLRLVLPNSFEVRMRDISSSSVGFSLVCLKKCRLKRKYVSDGILFSVRKYQADSAVFIAAAAFSGKRTVVWAFAFKAFAAFFETVGFLETIFLKAVFFETVFFETVFFMAFAA